MDSYDDEWDWSYDECSENISENDSFLAPFLYTAQNKWQDEKLKYYQKVESPSVQSSLSAPNMPSIKYYEVVDAGSLSAPDVPTIKLGTNLSSSSTSDTSEYAIALRSIKSAPEVPSTKFIVVLKKRSQTPRY